MQGLTDHEKELAAANGGQTASLITQLHGLIRLLQTHPDLPLSAFGDTGVRFYVKSAAEVDAVAAELLVAAAWNRDRTHYSAIYPFGTNVSYGAVYITAEHMEAHGAHMAAFRPAQVKAVAA